MTVDFSAYGLDKPLVIGEFDNSTMPSLTAAEMYTTIYKGNYNGAWGWAINTNPKFV